MSPLSRTLASLAIAASLSSLGCEPTAKIAAPRACQNCFTEADEVIQGLAAAYQQNDYDLFTGLFPTSESDTQYLFILDPSSEPPFPNWDAREELRLARRMFVPSSPIPGETPVSEDLWIESISASLVRVNDWSEREDLLRSDSNPTGLDPAHWRAIEAEFHADGFFATRGETDYRADTRAIFVVIEDLRLAQGSPRKFQIYRWEERGTAGKTLGVEPASWARVKGMYR